MITYIADPIRPPTEAASLMVHVTNGCPWHRCKFCSPYHNQGYERIPLDDVLKEISASEGQTLPSGTPFTTAFLKEADAMELPTKHLIAILTHLKKVHPKIDRVTTYARAVSLYKKSVPELRELYGAGLRRIHRGLETGYFELLKYMRKGSSPKIQIEGGLKVKEAGLSLSDYVMPGLGGDLELEIGHPAWKKHALETARVCNEVNPDYIRLRTYTHQTRSPLFANVQKDEFHRLSDQEIIEEIRLFISSLDGISSEVISWDHTLNTLAEVSGKMPQDRPAMLSAIDRYLSWPLLMQYEFRIGKLFRHFTRMGEFKEGYIHGRSLEAAIPVLSEATEKTQLPIVGKSALTELEKYEFRIGKRFGLIENINEMRERFSQGEIFEILVKNLLIDVL